MEKDKKSHIDDLILAVLENRADRQQRNELKAWLNGSEENRRYFMECQEIWFAAVRPSDLKQFDDRKAFQEFKQRVASLTASRKKTHRFSWHFVKYAAAVLVVGMIAYFSYKTGETDLKDALGQVEIKAPMGGQVQMCLPDSTRVTLNAGSTLVYSQDFGIYNRQVNLEGEGFFEVARNKQIPFVVSSRHVEVLVLGTTFNFRDYADDEEVVVSLFKGKVALENLLQQEAEMILQPNERMYLDKRNGRMKRENGIADGDKDWLEGNLHFEASTLKEVARMLSRSYGVSIRIANDTLEKLKINGTFNRKEQSLDNVLEAMETTKKIRYRHDDAGNVTLY